MKTLLNRLGSIRITLAVLLLLAGAAAMGTFLPRGQDMGAWENLVGVTGTRVAVALGLADFYHSFWFVSLLTALVVNLLACMVNRIPVMLASLSGKAALGREAVIDLPDSEDSLNRVISAFESLGGFKPRRNKDARIWNRGASDYLFTLLAHGSVLVIMASSILGSAAGFIATQRVYVGDSIRTAYNWKVGGDRPLPFEVRVEKFTLDPHPVGVRLGIMEVRTQRKGKIITTHVGGTFEVPGLDGKMKLESFDAGQKDFVASWTAVDGNRQTAGRDEEISGTGISLVPIAFATWPERQATAGVTLVHPDSGTTSGEISVNHPMVTSGIRIYLTDYGRDGFGLPYVGFQFVRDPGQAGVWAGSVLFLVCVTGAVLIRHSCAVLVSEDGRLRVHLSSRENRDEISERLLDSIGSRDGGQLGGNIEA